MNLYNFELKSIDEDALKLSDYEGKVLLLVNTASKCGFTPQYEGLQKLHETYADQGLVIIGFPCNQFADKNPELPLKLRASVHLTTVSLSHSQKN